MSSGTVKKKTSKEDRKRVYDLTNELKVMIDEMKTASAGRVKSLWPQAVRLYEFIYPWLDSVNTHEGFITPRYTISAINHFFEAMNEDGPKDRYPDFNAISKDDPLIRASEWYNADWFERQGRSTPDPYEDIVTDPAADSPNYITITPTPTPTPGPSTNYSLRKRKTSSTLDGGSAPKKLRGRKPKPTAWEVIVIDSDRETTIPAETPEPTSRAGGRRGAVKGKGRVKAGSAVDGMKGISAGAIGDGEGEGAREKKEKQPAKKRPARTTKSKGKGKGKGKNTERAEKVAKSKGNGTLRPARFDAPVLVVHTIDGDDEEEIDELAGDNDEVPRIETLVDEENEVAELVGSSVMPVDKGSPTFQDIDDDIIIQEITLPPRRAGRALSNKEKAKTDTTVTEVIDVVYDDAILALGALYDASNPIDVDASERKQDKVVAAVVDDDGPTSPYLVDAVNHRESFSRPEEEPPRVVVDEPPDPVVDDVASSLHVPEEPTHRVDEEAQTTQNGVSQASTLPIPVESPTDDMARPVDDAMKAQGAVSKEVQAAVEEGSSSVSSGIQDATATVKQIPYVDVEQQEPAAHHSPHSPERAGANAAQTSSQQGDGAEIAVEKGPNVTVLGAVPRHEIVGDRNTESRVVDSLSLKEITTVANDGSPNQSSGNLSSKDGDGIPKATAEPVSPVSSGSANAISSANGYSIIPSKVQATIDKEEHADNRVPGGVANTDDSKVATLPLCSACTEKGNVDTGVTETESCGKCCRAAGAENSNSKPTSALGPTVPPSTQTTHSPAISTSTPPAASSVSTTGDLTTSKSTSTVPSSMVYLPTSGNPYYQPYSTYDIYDYAIPQLVDEVLVCERCIEEKTVCTSSPSSKGSACDRCKTYKLKCVFPDLEKKKDDQDASINTTESGDGNASTAGQKRARKAKTARPSKRAKGGKSTPVPNDAAAPSKEVEASSASKPSKRGSAPPPWVSVTSNPYVQQYPGFQPLPTYPGHSMAHHMYRSLFAATSSVPTSSIATDVVGSHASMLPQMYPSLSAATASISTPKQSAVAYSSRISTSIVPQLYPSLSAAVPSMAWSEIVSSNGAATTGEGSAASVEVPVVVNDRPSSASVPTAKAPDVMNRQPTDNNTSGRSSADLHVVTGSVESDLSSSFSGTRPPLLRPATSFCDSNGSNSAARTPTPPAVSPVNEQMQSPPPWVPSSFVDGSYPPTSSFKLPSPAAREPSSIPVRSPQKQTRSALHASPTSQTPAAASPKPSQQAPTPRSHLSTGSSILPSPSRSLERSPSSPRHSTAPLSTQSLGSSELPAVATQVTDELAVIQPSINRLPSPPGLPRAADTIPNMVIQQLDNLRANFDAYKEHSDIEGLKLKVDSMQSTLESFSSGVARILDKIDSLVAVPASTSKVVREVEVQSSVEDPERDKYISTRVDASIQTDPRPKRGLAALFSTFDPNGMVDDDDDDVSEVDELMYPDIGP